ncbi:hypothetical protein SE17_25995 [Kouleothrix aurantiaca]|uniref:Uncharacterized protein n=1 Tax=Kouleothrix aurantiaca TaxID=186479 RepID=A0A0P9D5Y1_9CHLR|nr:hypothetical protein SE17_25995 [Kouleothrix aurantiaca]
MQTVCANPPAVRATHPGSVAQASPLVAIGRPQFAIEAAFLCPRKEVGAHWYFSSQPPLLLHRP